MNWPEIEGIIYADEPHPEKILGARIIGNQTLIQAFLPMADQVSVLVGTDEKEYPMECMDEDGFYAVLIPGKIKEGYLFRMKSGGKDGETAGTGQTACPCPDGLLPAHECPVLHTCGA